MSEEPPTKKQKAGHDIFTEDKEGFSHPKEPEEPMAEAAGDDHSSTLDKRRPGRIFNPQRPMKLQNHGKLTFTKAFKFKIYANNWFGWGSGNTPTDPCVTVGFMNVIPWQALCMYLSPDEYLEVVRNNHYAKIEHAEFEMEYHAVRTPFTAGSEDTNEANGNLQFELCRWDGLEQAFPFAVADMTAPNQPEDKSNFTFNQTYQELIKRLYGRSIGYNGPYKIGVQANPDPYPATMQERGLTWRPCWQNTYGQNSTAIGGMYRQINSFISSIPIYEYTTDCLNTNQVKMGEGYPFMKSYKPKNGLITMASTAYNPTRALQTGLTRINQKTRHQDNVAATITSDCTPQYIALYPSSTETIDVVTGVTKTQTEYASANDVRSAQVNTDLSSKCYFQGGTTGLTECGSSSDKLWFPGFKTTNNLDCENIGDLNWGRFFTIQGSNLEYITDVQTTAINAPQANNDQFGYGYNNDLAYYSVANLENYTMFTSRNEPPIHHMESLLIGAVPKINKDGSIVQATFEFTVKTRIHISTNHVHPTYNNMAQAAVTEQGFTALQYIDPGFQAAGTTPAERAAVVYGGRWQHNETDVCLNDAQKFWNHSYGVAAKPLFSNLDCNVPLRK